ncbi:helicase [Archaeoglobales archaeon]|nr:MAG: helicase [Archaeoglobales archaeon]
MISKVILNVLQETGIEELNEMQVLAAEKILKGKNLLIIAPTGSGKTEAAIIPILQKILLNNYEGIALLYITPLRALNRDMLRRLEKIAKKLGLTIAVRHGDTTNAERRKQSAKPPQILVTTPETFQILFLGKKLKKALKNVKFVVVDEVHELADTERGAQLSVALERLRKITDFQIIGLSATIKNKKKVARFLGKNVEVIESYDKKEYDFKVIKPKLKKEDERLAQELFVDVEVASELRKIKEIVEEHNSALIFVNTRQTAEALGLKLKRIVDVDVHHGSLSRDARIESENKFVNGDLKALICTSSMELGIDIGHVDVVIQYNSPREVARLIQRVGRSGHKFGRISKGFIVADSFDEILESWIMAKRAKEGKIEEIDMHFLSLDTLANQISAMALEYGRIDAEKVYGIVKRAYPFRMLSFDRFVEICEFLNEANVVGFDGSKIFAKRMTRRYFYDNISMIPDEKNYKVVDITTNKVIGVLDESFLSTFSGEVFTIKGELWRVVSVDDVVKVEPVSREGEIPSWVGEEIPVPFEVAQDVGMLRMYIASFLRRGNDINAIKALMSEFNTNEEACKEVVRVIERQLDKGFSIPSHSHITIESANGITVINACFGHKVNEALGRVVALLLSARKGRNIGLEIDPYRIKLQPANSKEVEEIVRQLDADSIEWLAERALIDTKLLQWRVVNAARKFGLLAKDDEINRINLRKLVLKLKDTPIYKEAVREIFLEKMDVERLKKIVEGLDEFTISCYNSLSPISLASREHTFDLLMPSKPTAAILSAFKRRLENEDCIMHCLNCNATFRGKVKYVRLQCAKCKSKFVACINARRNVEDIDKKELYKIANLVMSYGMNAVYAMNTYGVGVESAARILSRYYPNEESFFAELLEAEKRYIRTRKFWDR